MRAEERILFHLQEAKRHEERIRELLPGLEDLVLKSFHTLSVEEKNRLDALVFRFIKLQDLMGGRIFREYLECVHYPVEGENFLELLRELEKEGILTIDEWGEFRALRNAIAHDYPYEEHERSETVAYLIEHIQKLIEIVHRIEERL